LLWQGIATVRAGWERHRARASHPTVLATRSKRPILMPG